MKDRYRFFAKLYPFFRWIFCKRMKRKLISNQLENKANQKKVHFEDEIQFQDKIMQENDQESEVKKKVCSKSRRKLRKRYQSYISKSNKNIQSIDDKVNIQFSYCMYRNLNWKS